MGKEQVMPMELGIQLLYQIIKRLSLPFFIVFACSSGVLAQEVLVELPQQRHTSTQGESIYLHNIKKIIQFDESEMLLGEALQHIADQAELKLSYSEELIPIDKKVMIEQGEMTAEQALWMVLDGTSLRFGISSTGQLFFLARPDIPVEEILQVTVSGMVTDAQTGEALPGVNVIVGGSEEETGAIIGTQTDLDGNYSINVPDELNTLVFTYIGYQRLEVIIDGRNQIDIQLQQDIQMLDDLVVVGYGVQRRGDITGSVATVSPRDVDAIPTHNPLNALQGRLPGLHITRDGTPGGGTRSILIRGYNTLGSNDPLVIIDGQPVTGYPGSQALDFMNPNDIESIQVLKDAAASSIYGSRAAGGVIIITTKEATPGIKVEFNSHTTLQQYSRPIEMLNAEQLGKVYWRASINDGRDPNLDHHHYSYDWEFDSQGNPIMNNMEIIEWLDRDVQGGIRTGDTNWFSEISRPGYIARNTISVSHGGTNHSMYFSVGHHYNQGVVKFTDYERTSARLNSSLDLFNGRIIVGENLQFVTSTRTPMGSGQGGTPINLAFITLPTIPVYAEDGSFAGPIGPGFANRMNPLHVANLTSDYKNNMKNINGNAYLNFSVSEDFIFSSSFGIDYRDREHLRYDPTFQSGFLREDVARYSRSLPQDFSWTWHNTLNYNFQLGEHRASILTGTEAIYQETSTITVLRENFLLENTDYMYLDSGVGTSVVSGIGSGYQLQSYFSKIDYSYHGKYLASATLRYDGSSRFGENHRWGFFPSVSFGWRISAEEFLYRNLEFISNLVTRIGIGRTGNQQIGNNARFSLFRPAYDRVTNLWQQGTAYDLTGSGSGTLPSGIVADQIINPNLRWEQTDEINLGIDIGLYEEKLTGSIDYFIRKTSGILLQPPYLAVHGEGGAQWQNGADMSNKGWEVQLSYNDRIGNLTYRINANIASFIDEVTFVPDAVLRAYPGNVEQTIIGQSIASLFGYKTDGIFQNQEDVNAHADQPGKGIGRIRYKDLNGDGTINELDQTWLGTEIPDIEYGLNINVGFKNLSLTAFFQGVHGLYRFNSNINRSDFLGGELAGTNRTTRLLNAWTPMNSESNIPMLSTLDDNNETRRSDYQIQNASYLKLRNLQLGYTLADHITKMIGANNVQIYISGTELFTIKSNEWVGSDPENPSSFYPITRGMSIGLNLAF